MKDVTIVEGLPRADSRWIAEQLGVQHKNVVALLDAHTDDMREFGTFAFETRKSGGRPVRFAFLTEEQALFLGTLAKNTKDVVAFKKQLVRAFAEARRALQRSAKRTPITAHTSIDFQKANSRRVNGYLADKYGQDEIRQHNHDNCTIHDRQGRSPSELKEVGRRMKLPSKRRNSGKAVMREIDPAGACCMSLADTLVVHTGKSVREVSHVSVAARNVFAGMLALGVTPAELDGGVA